MLSGGLAADGPFWVVARAGNGAANPERSQGGTGVQAQREDNRVRGHQHQGTACWETTVWASTSAEAVDYVSVKEFNLKNAGLKRRQRRLFVRFRTTVFSVLFDSCCCTGCSGKRNWLTEGQHLPSPRRS